MLINASDASGEGYFNCCIPLRYRNPESFKNRVDHLETKLLDETLKPFKSSGHAFVCFDSVKSANLVLQKFRIGPI